MTMAPLGIDPALVLSSWEDGAYVDTQLACGVPGIALAFREGTGSYRLMTCIDRPRDFRSTSSARYMDRNDVVRRLREETVARIVYGEESDILATLLPSPRATGTGERGDGLPARAALREMAIHAVEAAALPDAMRDALRACLEHGVPWQARLLHSYRRALRRQGHRDEPAWAALTFAARNPRLASLLMAEDWIDSSRSPPAVTPDPMDMVRERWPGVTPAHLARFRDVGEIGDRMLSEQLPTANLLVACSLLSLPADWFPGEDAEEWRAFLHVERAARALVGLGSHPARMRDLLGPSKGRWVDYRKAVFRSTRDLRTYALISGSAGRLEREGEDARDPVNSLATTLVAPLMAHAGNAERIDAEQSAAFSLLYGGSGLVSVLRTSEAWHARHEAINAALKGAHTAEWPALLTEPYVVGDVEVSCVSDGLSLTEEGASGPDRHGVAGLAHCVASRLPSFQSGQAHLLSLRRMRPDGSRERLSTCQVRVMPDGPNGPELRVEEHRGHANADPPEDARTAVAGLVLAVGRGTVALSPEAAVRALAFRTAASHDVTSHVCGYDWRDPGAMARAVTAWEPLLPRWARGLGPMGLHAALVQRGILPPPGAPAVGKAA